MTSSCDQGRNPNAKISSCWIAHDNLQELSQNTYRLEISKGKYAVTALNGGKKGEKKSQKPFIVKKK